MDPNACLARFIKAVSEDANSLEAVEAHENLSQWLKSGGFNPRWNAECSRKAFISWKPGDSLE